MKAWQIPLVQYWGRHDKRYPVDDGYGYQYNPVLHGNGIIRAFVADGTVNGLPSWEKSPQVRAWMDDPKESLWKRFKNWLDK